MIFNFTSFLGGVNQGLLWGLLAVGVYLTFRILNFPDLTTDGSFSLGGSIVAIAIFQGVNPFLATLFSFFAGAAAGLFTGLLNTKLKIPPILSGILTMIAMYSINVRIMNGASLSIYRSITIITWLRNLFDISSAYSTLIMGIIYVTATISLLYWFFGTEKGSAIRATGSNEMMCRAQGINTNNTKIIALMVSNAIIALSGALVAQQQSTGDINMGVGGIVIGLASVIIGETFITKKASFFLKMCFVILGSIIYRLIITFVIQINLFNASDIKMLTAAIVIFALSIPKIKESFGKMKLFFANMRTKKINRTNNNVKIS